MKKAFSIMTPVLIGLLTATTGLAQIDGQGRVPTPPTVVPTGSEAYNLPINVQDTVSASYGIPNVLLKNDFNIFYAPGNMFRYGTAYAEIWNNEPWGGFTLKGPFGLKTAIFINRPYTGRASWYETNIANYAPYTAPSYIVNTVWGTTFPPTGNLSALIPRNLFDLLIGGRLGDAGGFGIKFTFAENSARNGFHSDSSPTNRGYDGTMSNAQVTIDHHLTLGLSFNKLLFFSGFDLSADIGFLSFDNTYRETFRTNRQNARLETKSLPGANLAFLMRPMVALPDDGLMVIMLGLNLSDVSSEYLTQVDMSGDGIYTNKAMDQNSDVLISDKSVSFASGIAIHTRPTERLRIIYSAGYNYDTRKTAVQDKAFGTNSGTHEVDVQTVAVPIAFSIEHETASWFKLRFGISQDLFYDSAVTTKDSINNPVTSIQSQSVFNSFSLQGLIITLGVGFVPLEDLEIDVALTADAFDLSSMIGRASVRFHY